MYRNIGLRKVSGARWCRKHGAPQVEGWLKSLKLVCLFIFIISHHRIMVLWNCRVICVLDGVNKPREYIWPPTLK